MLIENIYSNSLFMLHFVWICEVIKKVLICFLFFLNGNSCLEGTLYVNGLSSLRQIGRCSWVDSISAAELRGHWRTHICSMWPATVGRVSESERHERVDWDRSQTHREGVQSAATLLFYETCGEWSSLQGNRPYRGVPGLKIWFRLQ